MREQSVGEDPSVGKKVVVVQSIVGVMTMGNVEGRSVLVEGRE